MERTVFSLILVAYCSGYAQQQDPLDVASGGDKNKDNNIVIEGLPGSRVRGDVKNQEDPLDLEPGGDKNNNVPGGLRGFFLRKLVSFCVIAVIC
jgi:hypothetical protein